MADPTYEEFLEDPDRVENVTLELYPRSIAVPVTFPGLYFTMQEFGTLLEELPSGSYAVPAGQLFSRRIDGGFQRQQADISSSGNNASFLYGFIPQNKGGTISLFQRHGDIDLGAEPPELLGVPIREYSFGGRRAVVRHGGKCSKGEMRLADYRVLLDGECVGQPLVDESRVHFVLQGKEHRLNQPLLKRKLYGTDWCIHLNGTNGHLGLVSNAAYTITNQMFRIEFLIWLEEYPPGFRVILSRSNGSTIGYRIGISSSGFVQLTTYQASASQTTVMSAIPLKQWVRVSFIRTTTENINGYYDGEDETVTHDVHIDPADSSGLPMYIGRDNAGTAWLECLIDDIRIATSEDAGLDEETMDFQSFRELDDIEEQDFVLYLKCNERAPATIALDSSPTGGNAGLSAGATFVPSGMGRTDSTGTLIPRVFGEKEGITPLPVDLSIALHCVSAGPIESFEAVRIGLNDEAFDESIATAHTDFYEFVLKIANNVLDPPNGVPEGSYSTYIGPYWTMIVLGNSPNHPLTLRVKGDNTGGTFHEYSVETIRHIVTTYGETPFDDTDEITDAEFDALNAEFAAKCALYIVGEDTIQAVIDSILVNIGAVMWVDDVTGRLRIKVMGPARLYSETVVADLTIRNVEIGSFRVRENGNPFWKVNVFYDQCPTPMGTEQILEEMRGTEIEEYHRRVWRLKDSEKSALKRIFKDAPECIVYTTLTEEEWAQSEAKRLSNLLRRPDQGFTFFSPHIPSEIGLYDAVVFHYQDLDDNGEEQSRYGTNEISRFYVVGKRLAIGRGGFDIALWRPIVTGGP